MNKDIGVILVVILTAVFLVPPVFALTWNESSDAGPLPANAEITVGAGALTTIQGAFLSNDDIDMYCIRVADRSVFSATLFCLAHTYPDLWLFDAAGNGVVLHDACQASQVRISGTFIPSNGLYYLAITAHDRDAISASTQPIWNPPFMTAQRAPDGPGAPGPITNWSGTPLSTSSNYTISLNGAAFCDTPVPVTTRTWGEVKSRHNN